MTPEDKQRSWLKCARPRSPSGERTSTPPTTEEIRQYTGSPGTTPARHTDANPFVDPGHAGGWNEAPSQTKSSSSSLAEQRAAEIAKRRADFNATDN